MRSIYQHTSARERRRAFISVASVRPATRSHGPLWLRAIQIVNARATPRHATVRKWAQHTHARATIMIRVDLRAACVSTTAHERADWESYDSKEKTCARARAGTHFRIARQERASFASSGGCLCHRKQRDIVCRAHLHVVSHAMGPAYIAHCLIGDMNICKRKQQQLRACAVRRPKVCTHTSILTLNAREHVARCPRLRRSLSCNLATCN